MVGSFGLRLVEIVRLFTRKSRVNGKLDVVANQSPRGAVDAEQPAHGRIVLVEKVVNQIFKGHYLVNLIAVIVRSAHGEVIIREGNRNGHCLCNVEAQKFGTLQVAAEREIEFIFAVEPRREYDVVNGNVRRNYAVLDINPYIARKAYSEIGLSVVNAQRIERLADIRKERGDEIDVDILALGRDAVRAFRVRKRFKAYPRLAVLYGGCRNRVSFGVDCDLYFADCDAQAEFGEHAVDIERKRVFAVDLVKVYCELEYCV